VRRSSRRPPPSPRPHPPLRQRLISCRRSPCTALPTPLSMFRPSRAAECFQRSRIPWFHPRLLLPVNPNMVAPIRKVPYGYGRAAPCQVGILRADRGWPPVTTVDGPDLPSASAVARSDRPSAAADPGAPRAARAPRATTRRAPSPGLAPAHLLDQSARLSTPVSLPSASVITRRDLRPPSGPPPHERPLLPARTTCDDITIAADVVRRQALARSVVSRDRSPHRRRACARRRRRSRSRLRHHRRGL
jgi:hypothetical protein